MISANEAIRDISIARSINNERYKQALVTRILKLLQSVDADIVGKIASNDLTEFSRTRLERLLSETRALIDSRYELIAEEITKNLQEFAGENVEAAAAGLSKTLGGTSVVTVAGSKAYGAAVSRPFQGRFLKDWYLTLSASKKLKLSEQIRIGYFAGEGTDQIVRRLVGVKSDGYVGSIFKRGRTEAAAVVKTAVAYMATNTENQIYRANARYIDKVQWLSTLDSKTTPICQSRDGNLYEIDKGPRPPAHVGCRSVTVPILKKGDGFPELPKATRSSLDGRIPAETTYEQWIRGKSADFQDDVLGKTKGRLFRQGNLSLDKFVNRNGGELTLDQVRSRNRKVWDSVIGDRMTA